MRLFYSIGIYLYYLSIRLVAVFNGKARQWVEGRRGQFEKLERSIDKSAPLLWFHCASLGEFEQGRPVLEAIRKNYPDHKLLLSFFSPSGYEIRKDYDGADYIVYLPMDTPANAKRFLNIIQPRMAFFVKYEFWYNYIEHLHKAQIPLISFSVIFRPTQHFFKGWGFWFRKQLGKINWIFVQDEASLKLLQGIGFENVSIGGDTRFDRVLQLVDTHAKDAVVEAFKAEDPIFIGGSTWPADEKLILDILEKSPHTFKLIVAPHLIDESHINKLLQQFQDFGVSLYSKYNKEELKASRVLIVDTIGHLSSLYYYAKLAYIGGGFGVGIHNTLEAAAYGKPVMFGPNYQRFKEAVDLADLGVGFSVDSSEEGLKIFNQLFSDYDSYENICSAANNYVRNNAGASQGVIDRTNDLLND